MTTWISRREPDAVAADVAAAAGSRLGGLRLAVKDNIDVRGLPTTAGCPSFAYEPTVDATVVARLLASGAVVVGKANLDQFATGLVGTRSPYGALQSPIAPGRVAGGSSSGSAVAVATGEADVALGTDTAGSGRVPAAFCGVVGLKPTRGWLPTTGVVPACRSFDCVSVFARDVVTAAAVVEAAAGWSATDPGTRHARPGRSAVEVLGRLGRSELEAACDPAVVDAYEGTLARSDLPIVEVDLGAYLAAGRLLYGSALVAERWASVGAFVATGPEGLDPVVRSILEAAADHPAAALVAAQAELAARRREAASVFDLVDAVVVPTAPSHPTLAEVASDPLGVNAALGRFTAGANLVDWCAAAVPGVPRADGLPAGITVLGPAWSDRAVWAAAAALAELSGPPAHVGHGGRLPLAVCGAHLAGEPLHHQLADRGARLVTRTRTAPAYRMVRLPTDPPKPGLVRVGPTHPAGASVEVEVWDLEPAAFGTFVAGIPAPLGIGTLELVDGSWVQGFLCEPHAAAGAEDISAYGGWRAWSGRSA